MTELKKFYGQGPMELTFSQRLDSYLAGQEVDLIPFDIFGIEVPLALAAGYTREELWSDLRVELEIHNLKKDLYGIDYIYLGPNLRNFCTAFGGTTYTSDQGDGLIKTYPLEDYEMIDELFDIDIKEDPTFQAILDKAKLIKEKNPQLKVFYEINGPMTIASSLRPIERILKDTRKDPENFHKLMDLATKALADSVAMYVDSFGPVFIKIADPFSTMDLLAKPQFERFSEKYFNRLVDSVVELTGIKPMVHVCGHTQAIWENFKAMDISRFSVDNIEDMGQLKEELGDEIIIEGNIDPVSYLVEGSPQAVTDETRRIIQQAADSPQGFVFNAGCTISPATPMENVEAMVQAICDFGQGAQLGQLPRGID